MKITKNSSKINKKNIAVIVAVVLIPLIGFIAVQAVSGDDKDTQQSEQKEESRKKLDISRGDRQDDTPDNEPVDGGEDLTEPSPDTTPQPNITPESPKPNPQPTSNADQVSLTITAKNQLDSVYQIRTLIDSVINSGECSLTMSSGSQTYSQTVGVQTASNNSTCQGFDIPLSRLSAGDWSIKINLVRNNETIGSASSTIKVN